MPKGRTRNPRARKPVTVYQPAKWPPPAPTAYFRLPDQKHGYAEAALGKFYDPLEPVYKFRIIIMPTTTKGLDWSPAGWQGDLGPEEMPDVTAAVERTFTPMQYRWEPIQI